MPIVVGQDVGANQHPAAGAVAAKDHPTHGRQQRREGGEGEGRCFSEKGSEEGRALNP